MRHDSVSAALGLGLPSPEGCDGGSFYTQDLCNISADTRSNPPIVCPNPEPRCLVPVCDESADMCDIQPITPDPRPWRCGNHWCV